MTPSLPFVIKLSVEVRAVLQQRARAYPACHAHRAQVCSASGRGSSARGAVAPAASRILHTVRELTDQQRMLKSTAPGGDHDRGAEAASTLAIRFAAVESILVYSLPVYSQMMLERFTDRARQGSCLRWRSVAIGGSTRSTSATLRWARSRRASALACRTTTSMPYAALSSPRRRI
jgi:hypothetical protein